MVIFNSYDCLPEGGIWGCIVIHEVSEGSDWLHFPRPVWAHLSCAATGQAADWDADGDVDLVVPQGLGRSSARVRMAEC